MKTLPEAQPRACPPGVPGAGGGANRARSGGGLIEVMLGCLILGILAITASAYVYHTSRTLALQRDRTSAMTAMNGCLEERRATSYASLTNQTGITVTSTSSDGIPLRTRMEFLSLGGTNNALLLTVEARYRAVPSELWISNRTIYAP